MKRLVKSICLCLSVAMFMIFLVACSNNAIYNSPNIDDACVRTIEVEQLSNQQAVETMIDKFNNYDTSFDDTSVEFNGDMTASIGEILGCDSLAYHDETVVKKISTRLDYESFTFYMCISYFSDNSLLEVVETEVQPLYDEERDDGYIEYENERYYISETLSTDSLDECVAGVDDVVVIGTGAVLVAGLLITIVATPPDVHRKVITTVKTVVETVVQAVKSFWRWFTSWIKKTVTRTETVTSVVYENTPTIKIGNVKYETRSITKEERRRLPKTPYYIAFGDPTNNKFYISTISISSTIATVIMSSPIRQSCIGNSRCGMVTSVFTMAEENAISVMDRVGYDSDTPKYNPKYEHGLYHYHSRKEISVPTRQHPEGEMRRPHMYFEILIGVYL